MKEFICSTYRMKLQNYNSVPRTVGNRRRIPASTPDLRATRTIAHRAVETSEHAQILPHGEAMRHVDIGTLEVHPAERAVTVARHVDAERADLACARQG